MKSFFQKIKSILHIESKNELHLEVSDHDRNLPWHGIEPLYNLPNVHIGKYTYGLELNSIMRATENSPVSIGSFCSFAPGVKILAHSNHPTNFVTTYPLKTLFANSRSNEFDSSWTNHDAITKGAINIGHDVWVGQSVIILSGVTIGNGAVIGAGSVVSKNIPPYAIVVGNPAKVIKYRFNPETIESLEKVQWWNLSDQEIESLMPYLYSEPNLFLSELIKKKL